MAWHLTRRSFLRAAIAMPLVALAGELGGCALSAAVSTARPATVIPSSPSIAPPTRIVAPGIPISPAATQATPSAPGIAPAATVYLDAALDYIQANALLRDRVSWPTARLQARLIAADAQTTADTYQAIRFVLQQLGDRHSVFYDPARAARSLGGRRRDFGFFADGTIVSEVFPAGPATATGIRVGDIVETIDGLPADAVAVGAPTATTAVALALRHPDGRSLTVTLAPTEYDGNRDPEGRHLSDNLGYLDVPAFSGQGAAADRYATRLQAQIRALDGADAPPLRGWVIDLRRNRGGNTFAMLAGLGPILGEGVVGTLVGADGEIITTWSYRDGRALLGETVMAMADGPAYHPRRAAPPVALLQGQQTASAGELLIASSRGRPGTRRFGTYSAGIPTVNTIKELPDGAWIVLTTARLVDRTGQVATGSLRPDGATTDEWALLGTPDDRSVQAAIAWLQAQAQP